MKFVIRNESDFIYEIGQSKIKKGLTKTMDKEPSFLLNPY
jgi:hypothetical protein